MTDRHAWTALALLPALLMGPQDAKPLGLNMELSEGELRRLADALPFTAGFTVPELQRLARIGAMKPGTEESERAMLTAFADGRGWSTDLIPRDEWGDAYEAEYEALMARHEALPFVEPDPRLTAWAHDWFSEKNSEQREAHEAKLEALRDD